MNLFVVWFSCLCLSQSEKVVDSFLMIFSILHPPWARAQACSKAELYCNWESSIMPCSFQPQKSRECLWWKTELSKTFYLDPWRTSDSKLFPFFPFFTGQNERPGCGWGLGQSSQGIKAMWWACRHLAPSCTSLGTSRWPDEKWMGTCHVSTEEMDLKWTDGWKMDVTYIDLYIFY